MATAEAGDRREPPGLGPRTRRSTATSNMAGGGGEGKKGEPEGPQLYVLSLPAAALPLPVAVSRLDAAVPRKARSCCTRAKPSGWWSFRLPLPPPEVAKEPPQETRLPVLPPEEASPQGPQRLRGRMCVPPAVDDVDAPVMEKEKSAKRARRCLQCGSAETPQWRSGPMGRATLCNACGVRLRAAGALRDPEHGPPPATVTELPPGSPDSDSPPDSPIWEPQAPPREEVYLVRKPSKRRRKEAIIPPAPSIYLVKKQPSKKKKTPKKQPWRPRKTAKRCLHCGSSSTPQWRHGPMGRSTLCNACGVRYRQGRLLPEYRPAASPTFTPSEHANRHREVIQLRRQRQDKSHQHHHHPPPPQPVADDLVNVLVRRNKDPYPPTPLHQPLPQPMDDSLAAGNHNSAANVLPGCGDDLIDGVPSSLDSLLLDGPSAPLIVDGDEFVIS